MGGSASREEVRRNQAKTLLRDLRTDHGYDIKKVTDPNIKNKMIYLKTSIKEQEHYISGKKEPFNWKSVRNTYRYKYKTPNEIKAENNRANAIKKAENAAKAYAIQSQQGGKRRTKRRTRRA